MKSKRVQFNWNPLWWGIGKRAGNEWDEGFYFRFLFIEVVEA